MNTKQSEALLSQAAESLFRLGRLFSKVGASVGTDGQAGQTVELSRILIVQAVEELQLNSDQEVSIGAIAQQIGVEASTASRLVAEAIKEGYLNREVSSVDSRRAQLTLTASGRLLAEQARNHQLQIFLQLTTSWTEQEQSEFARLFVQFSSALAERLQEQMRTKNTSHPQ